MAKTVGEYIDGQAKEVRGVLRKVRGAIRKAVPKAEESITYQIPTYKLADARVIYFAAWKAHWSLYPVSSAVVAALGKQLARYEVKKATIKFPYSEPVPAALIARIAKVRAAEVAR